MRKIVHARGLRYRVDSAPVKGLRRRADLLFTRARVAVFIDGCFWHGCPAHWTEAKTNNDFWLAKVEGNKARDADTDARLKDADWVVLRYWEHESPAEVADDIVEVVRRHLPTQRSRGGRSRG